MWAIRKRRRQKTMVLTMAGLNLDTPSSASDYDSVWQSPSNVKPDEECDENHSDGNTPIIKHVENIPPKRMTVHTEHSMNEE